MSWLRHASPIVPLPPVSKRSPAAPPARPALPDTGSDVRAPSSRVEPCLYHAEWHALYQTRLGSRRYSHSEQDKGKQRSHNHTIFWVRQFLQHKFEHTHTHTPVMRLFLAACWHDDSVHVFLRLSRSRTAYLSAASYEDLCDSRLNIKRQAKLSLHCEAPVANMQKKHTTQRNTTPLHSTPLNSTQLNSFVPAAPWPNRPQPKQVILAKIHA